MQIVPSEKSVQSAQQGSAVSCVAYFRRYRRVRVRVETEGGPRPRSQAVHSQWRGVAELLRQVSMHCRCPQVT